MERQYISFEIDHQKIARTDDFFVVGGSRNYLYAKFTFCDDWNGEQPVAIFTGGGHSYSKFIVDGECLVPWEVLQQRRFFVGCLAGERITSNSAVVEVCPCGVNVDAEESKEPTKSIYQQMLDAVQETKRIAQSVRDDAAAGKFNGAPGYTPKKGIDYYTEADKEEMVQAVLDALPDGDEVAY